MNNTVRIGVVGTSWWTDAMYMPALAKHPQADVRAVVGVEAGQAREFAGRWQVPAAYTTLEDMLDHEALDAVIIQSPNKFHYSMTMTAIERGLHVICEKPLAMNYRQALRLTEAAERAGVKAMSTFTYRFMPASRYLKELIDGGYIGRPYHLNLRGYAGFARGADYLWRFDVGEAGSGVAGDLATHWLYLAYWFFGEITAVTAQFGHHVTRGPRPDGQPYEPADDSANLLLEFASGATGAIHVSAVAYEPTPFGQTHHLEFHGSDGTLHSFTDWDKSHWVEGARAGEPRVQRLEIPGRIYGTARRDTVHNTYKDTFREHDHMARGFVTAIATRTPVAPTFRDGLVVQRCLDAAVRSAKEGRRVAIEEIR